MPGKIKDPSPNIKQNDFIAVDLSKYYKYMSPTVGGFV